MKNLELLADDVRLYDAAIRRFRSGPTYNNICGRNKSLAESLAYDYAIRTVELYHRYKETKGGTPEWLTR